MARSVIVSSSAIGTPSAVVVDSPKLVRMSLRTMPLSPSASGPLEPSPGYGPAVASGISPPDAPAVAEDDDVVPVAPQAASPNATVPRPNACRTLRRCSRVSTSKPRPWSSMSSSGRGSVRLRTRAMRSAGQFAGARRGPFDGLCAELPAGLRAGLCGELFAEVLVFFMASSPVLFDWSRA